MTYTIILIFSALLLIAYIFDITSSKTKIPSVILLLMLGFSVKYLLLLFGIVMPDLNSILPILGTVGLILIVLEGSLELEFNKTKLPLITKSFVGALLPMIALAAVFTYIFVIAGHSSFRDALINAIPFCIISSAIAIPSVKNLAALHKEYIIYESSLSDILGVIFFSFIAFNETFGLSSYGEFGLQIFITTVISIVATFALSYLLNKIDHHIKFVPIILLVLLIYAAAEIYHLPALIFIMLFGLAIGNLDELKNYKWMELFNPVGLHKEVVKFKELTIEGAFLIRSLFFLLFGFLLDFAQIIDTSTLLLAFVIVFFIFLFRAIQIKLLKLPLFPLMFVAPRGLITILLFLSINPIHNIELVNKSLIIQVILLTAFVMMFGLMKTNKNEASTEEFSENAEEELAKTTGKAQPAV